MKKIVMALIADLAVAGCSPSGADGPPAAAVAPVVEVERPPAPDGATRIEVTKAVYLDQYEDRVEVWVNPGGSPAKRLGTFEAPWKNAQTWTHVYNGKLVLGVTPNALGPGGHMYRIDLATGETADLGGMMGPPWRHGMVTSHDGRYLGLQIGSMGIPVQIMDFDTGETRNVSGEAHLIGATWSPTVLSLAVRTAEPGSGLPVQVASQWLEGGTHVDLIDPAGNVRHLHPPEPLQLTRGPVWSPDGRMIAVAAGVVKAIGQGPGGASEHSAKEIWAVEVETNRWIRLGDARAEETLTAWPPEGDRYLPKP